jgi:hypothetical protein
MNAFTRELEEELRSPGFAFHYYTTRLSIKMTNTIIQLFAKSQRIVRLCRDVVAAFEDSLYGKNPNMVKCCECEKWIWYEAVKYFDDSPFCEDCY